MNSDHDDDVGAPGVAPGACQRVEARLDALVDGALAPLEEARDRGHLEACTPCRGALARHERLLASLRSLARAEATRAETRGDLELVSAGVLARLGATGSARAAVSARPAGPRRWLAGLAAAAAAVLLLAWLESRAGLAAVASPAPRVALQHVLEQLPSWADVLRGLEALSRSFS